MVYRKIPIVETARRCGLVLDSRTPGAPAANQRSVCGGERRKKWSGRSPRRQAGTEQSGISSDDEAGCPFCGDHGTGKYHLSLNTNTDRNRCNLCGAHGNRVSLYARLKGMSN